MPIQFIPNSFSSRTPHSEKLVADWLTKDPKASRYTVYHSHGLGAHITQGASNTGSRVKPHGEIDFVILVPPLGLVTVEVKGDKVSRKEGIWYQKGNGYSRRINDPIRQMVSNQYELKRRLSSALGETSDLQSLIFAGLVILPKTDSCPPGLNLESNEWEVASYAEIRELGISGCIERTLAHTKRVLKKRNASPPPGLMSRVKAVIRADFDLPISPIVLREEEVRRRNELTEQQYQFLSVVEANGKALVEGGAGTGKTLLALEFAKRELIQGRKIAVFCYNNLLGAWLKTQCDTITRTFATEASPTLVVGTFQSWMHATVSKNTTVRALMEQEVLSRGDQNYWEILEECASLAVEELATKFDTVIIDEMQDFQRSSWLSLIDKSLSKGFKDGRWALFGDYSRQAIFAERGRTFSSTELQDEINGYGAYPVRIPLTLNCRNTKRIIEMTMALTSFSWNTTSTSGLEGKPVHRLYYKTTEEQFKKIQKAYADLINEEIEPKEIVLLWDSMSGTGSFEENAKSADLKLYDWAEDAPLEDGIRSSSIQRFKGLEADAVIVCNLQGISDLAIQQKLYVAMTRARSRLVLVLPHHLKDKVDDLMSAHFGGRNHG